MLNDVIVANKLYTRMMISDMDRIDEIPLRVLKKDMPEFLLPVKTMNIDGETEFRFELTEGTRFSYFNEKMTKKDFTVLLKNMLLPYKICADWFLDYHNLLLDSNYIILKRNNYSVKYIYISTREHLQTDEQIIKFFEELIIKMELTDDPGYTMKLLRIIKDHTMNLMDLLDTVTKDFLEDGEQVVKKQKNKVMDTDSITRHSEPVIQNTNASVFRIPELVDTNVQEKKEEAAEAYRPGQRSEFGKEDLEGQLLNNLFGEKEEKDEKKKNNSKKEKPVKEKKVKEKKVKEKTTGSPGIFGGLFKKNSKNQNEEKQKNEMPKEEGVHEQAASYTVSYQNNSAVSYQPKAGYYGDDATEICTGNEEVSTENKVVLKLEEAAGFNLPNLIELDMEKGFVTVGRFDKAGNAQCDYNFNSAMSFISRSHFRIENRNGNIQIIDLNSGNGTYINGTKIVSNIPYPLEKGDMIMFSSTRRVTYKVLY